MTDLRGYYQDPAEYDLAHGAFPDLEFWAEACRRYQPRAVLELAVGTGRVAIPLARQGVAQGFTVTGIDITRAMLARAEEKLVQEPAEVQQNLTLAEGDMRCFSLGQRFDLVFIAFNSILHLVALGDRMGAFGSARDHLTPGGRFIVDVFTPSMLLLAQAQEPVSRLELDFYVEDASLGERLVRSSARRYDETTQTIRSRLFTERYRKGRRGEKRASDAEYHIYFPEELRLLLQSCGFRIEDVFGDHQWGPFQQGCPRMVFVAQAA
ncbi:MAG: class I SAM-dependent methyltransferase [Chloroflexi bacterium]|nr:class I SAM-dependent methyltransferase [Chloroflexota bacterium]